MLKIEYLEAGSANCPLIRLYGYEPGDIAALRRVCVVLSEDGLGECVLESQPWVESVNGCRCLLRYSNANRGIRRPKSGQPHSMEYNVDGWLEVAEKLEPMMQAPDGHFQWLSSDGEVRMLISKSGQW